MKIDLERLHTQQQEMGRAMLRRVSAIRDDLDSLQWQIEQSCTLMFAFVLLRRVDELNLTTRTINALKEQDVRYIGDLVQRTEADLLKFRNLGHKGIDDIKEGLALYELVLGTRLERWPPPLLALAE